MSGIDLTIAQVAFVGGEVGMPETVAWYRDILGFEHTGGMKVDGGPDEADFLGVSEDPKIHMEWLIDRNDGFQIELYTFEAPATRPKPDSWSPRDIGYSLVTVWVADFDGTIERARAARSLRAEPVGEHGARRALIADPSGNLLELLESDVVTDPKGSRSSPGAAVRGIRASVPDLERSVRFFADGFGLPRVEEPGVLHRPEQEILWGLEGEAPVLVTFRTGNLFLELAQYDAPPGAPWPADHQMSDAGIMNVAVSTTQKDVYDQVADDLEVQGYRVRRATMNNDVSLAYVTDDQGFGVELLFMAPAAYREFGFPPVDD